MIWSTGLRDDTEFTGSPTSNYTGIWRQQYEGKAVKEMESGVEVETDRKTQS